MVRCRIAMPEVVSSNPGRGKKNKKINLQKVMGSDGKLSIFTLVLFVLSSPMLSMRSVMVSDCII